MEIFFYFCKSCHPLFLMICRAEVDSFDCSITTLRNPAAEKVLNFKNFNLSYPPEKVRARKKMQAKL